MITEKLGEYPTKDVIKQQPTNIDIDNYQLEQETTQ